MTAEESAFQAALDLNPDDHTTRLVFADWLQDRGDKRAEGYRALGRNELYCDDCWFNGDFPQYHNDGCGWMNLPQYWFLELRGGRFNKNNPVAFPSPLWCDFGNRLAAEESAVTAFTKLTKRRRLKLLYPKAKW